MAKTVCHLLFVVGVLCGLVMPGKQSLSISKIFKKSEAQLSPMETIEQYLKEKLSEKFKYASPFATDYFEVAENWLTELRKSSEPDDTIVKNLEQLVSIKDALEDGIICTEKSAEIFKQFSKWMTNNPTEYHVLDKIYEAFAYNHYSKCRFKYTDRYYIEYKKVDPSVRQKAEIIADKIMFNWNKNLHNIESDEKTVRGVFKNVVSDGRSYLTSLRPIHDETEIMAIYRALNELSINDPDNKWLFQPVITQRSMEKVVQLYTDYVYNACHNFIKQTAHVMAPASLDLKNHATNAHSFSLSYYEFRVDFAIYLICDRFIVDTDRAIPIELIKLIHNIFRYKNE